MKLKKPTKPRPPRIAITSGYFNPIHMGHIECFNLAKNLADKLIVIVNNDKQQILKTKQDIYQNEDTRLGIVASLKSVDMVVLSVDEDESVNQTLESVIQTLKTKPPLKQSGEPEWVEPIIIFAKGGDRYVRNIAEKEVCDKYGVEIIDGLGTKKDNSSDYRNKNKVINIM